MNILRIAARLAAVESALSDVTFQFEGMESQKAHWDPSKAYDIASVLVSGMLNGSPFSLRLKFDPTQPPQPPGAEDLNWEPVSGEHTDTMDWEVSEEIVAMFVASPAYKQCLQPA